MRSVELFGKPGCHLCDEARRVLLAARARHGFELAEIDVTSDPELLRAMRTDVPVVHIDGERAFVHRVDAAELERRLTARRASS